MTNKFYFIDGNALPTTIQKGEKQFEKNLIPGINSLNSDEKPDFIFVFYHDKTIFYTCQQSRNANLICEISYVSSISYSVLTKQSCDSINQILNCYQKNSNGYVLLKFIKANEFRDTLLEIVPFLSRLNIDISNLIPSQNGLGNKNIGDKIEKLNKSFKTLFWLNMVCEGDELNYRLLINTAIAYSYNCITPIEESKNIILNGAPGTGKTYLAHEIAANMLGKISWGEVDNDSKLSSHVGFVQFHPSYDYTDFVEGLRPVNNSSGTPSFVLTPGVFKRFCEDALEGTPFYLMRLIEERLSVLGPNPSKNELEEIDDLMSRIFKYIEGLKKELKVRNARLEEIRRRLVLTKKQLIIGNAGITKVQINSALNELKKPYSETINEFIDEITQQIECAADDMKEELENEKKELEEEKTAAIENEKKLENEGESSDFDYCDNELPYVFIIDEINRGEMSKIFGELFFSIDPGYRGTKGKVQTQYASMVGEKNKFDLILDNGKVGQFFVPENVFVIGTMNDIDRSVDSMDFAMRRRFAFREIDPKDNCGMIYEKFGSDAEKVIKVMDSLNKVIKENSGLNLGSEYQIGPSYFLGLKKNNNGEFDWEELWKSKLRGLLYEYIRGMDDTKTKMDNLKTAYKDGQKES